MKNGLSNGGSFYIKDSQDQIIKIVDGNKLPMSGSQSLALYYEKPANATLGINSAIGYNTIIAKKNDKWVVRFGKDWKNATVEVFSITGQLLNSKSNISTASDYIIPMNDQVRSGLIIKAVSENGEVVVKKIVN